MTSVDAQAATGASHEYVDHTSEVTIRARAASYEGLLAEMALAFTGLVPEHLRGDPSGEWREMRVAGSDRVGVLVALLNELVYLADVEPWVPEEVRVSCEEGGSAVCAPSRSGAAGNETPEGDRVVVRISARGRLLEKPFVLVKAATLHGAAVHDEPGGCSGEVTLDI